MEHAIKDPTKFTLPTWEECQAARDSGTASALENFIYNNEPAGIGPSISFRGELTEAILSITCPNNKISHAPLTHEKQN